MAVVDLPSSPGPARVTWREQDFGGTLPGLMGGGAQRDNGMGNRWAIDVRLPPMDLRDARRWSAALSLGLKNSVRFKIRQVGLASGPIGAPRVAGADQAGMTLNADGFTPGASWEAGQFAAVITDGVSYLYLLAASGFADIDGEAALAFTTMLRAVPDDNDVIDFAPSIEGLLAGDAVTWDIDEVRLGRAAFSIEEAD